MRDGTTSDGSPILWCSSGLTLGEKLTPISITLFPVLNPVPGALGVTVLVHRVFMTWYLRTGKQIKDREATRRLAKNTAVRDEQEPQQRVTPVKVTARDNQEKQECTKPWKSRGAKEPKTTRAQKAGKQQKRAHRNKDVVSVGPRRYSVLDGVFQSEGKAGFVAVLPLPI